MRTTLLRAPRAAAVRQPSPASPAPAGPATAGPPQPSPDSGLDRARRFGHRLEPPSAEDLLPEGGGRPLPAPVQRKMAAAFGHDFASVRVHENDKAPSIDAVAYTQGEHIHFAPGTYQPGSPTGQRLLGHELTHVVQQRGGRVAVPQGAGLPIADDAALEAEADRRGNAVAHGGPAPPASGDRAPGGPLGAVRTS